MHPEQDDPELGHQHRGVAHPRAALVDIDHLLGYVRG